MSNKKSQNRSASFTRQTSEDEFESRRSQERKKEHRRQKTSYRAQFMAVELEDETFDMFR